MMVYTYFIIYYLVFSSILYNISNQSIYMDSEKKDSFNSISLIKQIKISRNRINIQAYTITISLLISHTIPSTSYSTLSALYNSFRSY